MTTKHLTDSWRHTPIALIAALAVLAGCSTNPVTGEKQLTLISEEQEFRIGKENYAPYRQAQGGDYVIEPALTRYVQGVGQRLAAVSDRKLDYEFQIINESTPNAWALPAGKIALNRGLLVELESEAELAAVIGHEIVHAAARHSASAMERDALLQGAVAATGALLGSSDYQQIGMLGASLGKTLVSTRYDRHAEREADLYGIRYMVRAGYDPAAAVGLQETFVRLAEGKESNWLEGLFASHPPSRERVENNRRLVAQLNNPGGEVGRDRYQKMIARLLRSKPAYAAYDAAKEAADDKAYDKALKLLDKALAIEPDEALFHGLRGEIRQATEGNEVAITDYDRALDLNPGYYRFSLMRGMARRALGDTAGAEQDLQASATLLPTAEAYLGLGLVAQGSGRGGEAIKHFRTAAQSESTAGKLALANLVNLDLEKNPSRYVKANLGIDRSGNLLVSIVNESPVAVRAVRVVLGRRVGKGVREEFAYTLQRRLKPGEQFTTRTDIGRIDATSARGYAAVVTAARLATSK